MPEAVLKLASVLLYIPQMQYSKSIAPAMLEDCCLPNLYPSEQKGIYQSRDVPFSLCSAKTSFSLMLYGKNVTLSSLGSRGAEPGPFKAQSPHGGAVSKRPMRIRMWQQGEDRATEEPCTILSAQPTQAWQVPVSEIISVKLLLK